MTIPVNYFSEWRENIVLSRNANPWTYTFYPRGFGGRWGGAYGVAGITPRLQVRLYEGAPMALLSIGTSGASRLEAQRHQVVAMISQADLAALPMPAELGAPLILHYDLLVATPNGEGVSHFGTATIRTGVTR